MFESPSCYIHAYKKGRKFMCKKSGLPVLLIFASLFLFVSSNAELPDFQTNAENTSFNLFHHFDDYLEQKTTGDSIPVAGATH
jgi:hypothetical protein